MARLLKIGFLVVWTVSLTWAGGASAQSPTDLKARKAETKKAESAQSRYLRIVRDKEDAPLALQTSIVRFVPASGEGDLVVDLVGAVHIGDASYYNTLNKQFEQYDVVCYELVAEKGTRIPKGGRKDSDNPLAMVMDLAKRFLDLKSQVEAIDYTKDNFVHADMSPDEMWAAIKKRGDDGLTLMLGITADLLREQNRKALQAEEEPAATPKHLEDFDWSLLLDSKGPVKLKRMFAENFDEQNVTTGLGSTMNTILISDRNQAALKVFNQQVVKGHKRIAIFYGAAHMPDFEKRLRDELGLVPVSTTWMPAWDLRLRERGVEELLFRVLRDYLK
jgi:hypothetical protein